MATYDFATITSAQAAAIAAADVLLFSSGTAIQSTVSYGLNGTATITLGVRSVEFGPAISALSAPGLSFPDGSRLYIGSADSNAVGFPTDIQAALFGGDGNDTLLLGYKGGLAQGNQGNDTLQSNGVSTLYGGQGNDTLSAQATDHSFLQGNKGDDNLFGFNSCTLLGGQGNDTLQGSGYLDGNLGDDNIRGSGRLLGEDGADTISASTSVRSHGDTLDGGAGDDSITSAHNFDALIAGGDGNDTIIVTDAGTDTIEGGAGNDFMKAAAYTVFNGGDGADTITASFSSTVVGGSGSDLFDFSDVAASNVMKILDWSAEDRLTFLNDLRPDGFVTRMAPTYEDAFAIARTLVTGRGIIAVIQVNEDVYVFSRSPSDNFSGFEFGAIELAGRSLADISVGNII